LAIKGIVTIRCNFGGKGIELFVSTFLTWIITNWFGLEPESRYWYTWSH